MTSEIAVYESADFGDIRTVVIDGKTWFAAVDIARNLAYKDAAAMTRLLPDDEKGSTILWTPGGEQKLSIVNEAGLYRACVTRATARIKDPVTRERVEAFQHWILHEVLPGLRSDGFYLNVPPDQLDQAAYERLVAYMMAANAARIAALESRVEEMRPMAELGESVSAASNCIEVRELGHLLCQNGLEGMGLVNTFKLLRKGGYVFRNADKVNVPYQRWINEGLFQVQEVTYTRNGVKYVGLKTMVTPKGVEHLLRKYAPNMALKGLERAVSE